MIYMQALNIKNMYYRIMQRKRDTENRKRIPIYLEFLMNMFYKVLSRFAKEID